MVVEENAATPLSISKIMMVAEIQPTKDEPAREDRENSNEVLTNNEVEDNKDNGEKEHEESSKGSKVPDEVVMSVAKGKWSRSLALCERIFFFLMGVLMVIVASAIMNFHPETQSTDNETPVSTYIPSLNEPITTIPEVVL